MKCPGCRSVNHSKAGAVNGRQRFKCKDCRYHDTVEKKSGVKSAAVKRMAFEMYLEGLGFRATGRLLKISYGDVYQWIRKWGKENELPVRRDATAVVVLYEMHAYVNRKKTADEYGWLLENKR